MSDKAKGGVLPPPLPPPPSSRIHDHTAAGDRRAEQVSPVKGIGEVPRLTFRTRPGYLLESLKGPAITPPTVSKKHRTRMPLATATATDTEKGEGRKTIFESSSSFDMIVLVIAVCIIGQYERATQRNIAACVCEGTVQTDQTDNKINPAGR